MSRSRIFEEYAKIATEQGLVRQAADEGDLKVDMKAKDYSSRENYKREELSSSEILYGLEPNGKEKHVMEQAHPEPVIIAPSYDKINGLVENNIERNNIMVNQVLQQTDGNLNYKKLAEQELIYELVRIANDLDIRGEEELRSLADDCIERLSLTKEAGLLDSLKSMLDERLDDAGETAKGAAAGALIGGILGSIVPGAGTLAGAGVGAVAGGLIAAITKTAPKAKNVVINSTDTVSQIDDLIKKYPNKAFLTNLRDEVLRLKVAASQYVAMFDTATGEAAGTSDNVQKITNAYRVHMDAVRARAAEFNSKATAGEFAEDESNWWSKIQTGFHAFMDDDVDDVRDSLAALLRTIAAAEAGMNEVKNESKKSSTETPAKMETKPAISNQQSAPVTPVQTPSPAPMAQKPNNEDEELIKF